MKYSIGLLAVLLAVNAFSQNQQVANKSNLPELVNERQQMVSSSGFEPDMELIWWRNWTIIGNILDQDSPEMRQEITQRMLDAKTPMSLRMLYAGILASLGDENGQHFLLDPVLQSDDVEKTQDLFWLIGHFVAMKDFGDPNKKVYMFWAEDFMLKMVKETKYLKVVDRYDRIKQVEKFINRQDLALAGRIGNFAEILAKMKNDELYVVLTNLYEQRKSLNIYCSGEILSALGELQDERAIPLLLKVLAAHDEDYRSAAYSLLLMKCQKAVPVLLKYLDDYNTYYFLSRYDDPAILPALENALPDIKGPHANMEARFLIIKLKNNDKLPQLIALMKDPDVCSINYEIIKEIAKLKDKRSILFAIDLLNDSSDRFIIQEAINILGMLPTPRTTKALIDGLDIDFNRKVTRSKDMSDKNVQYRQAIAEILKKNTGKDFGVDKNQWLKWYNETYPKK